MTSTSVVNGVRITWQPIAESRYQAEARIARAVNDPKRRVKLNRKFLECLASLR